MSQPISITLGPDFWFTEQDSSQVARITPQGVITEFRTPTLSFPIDITAGPDRNIWFTEGSTGKIGFVTPQGSITEITFSTFDASSVLLQARQSSRESDADSQSHHTDGFPSRANHLRPRSKVLRGVPIIFTLRSLRTQEYRRCEEKAERRYRNHEFRSATQRGAHLPSFILTCAEG
jgi:hypothetical protein